MYDKVKHKGGKCARFMVSASRLIKMKLLGVGLYIDGNLATCTF
jgi:hypothetical protein